MIHSILHALDKTSLSELDKQKVTTEILRVYRKKVSKMIKDRSREVWVDIKGNDEGFEAWFDESNKLNLN